MKKKQPTSMRETVRHNQEELEQQWLIQWATMHSGKYPTLALLHHIPNGGLRSKTEAKRLKAAGVKAGVPDLFLPVPALRKDIYGDTSGTILNFYAGLYIEMKAPSIEIGGRKTTKGKTSKEQEWWIAQLREQGYRVEVCYGWAEAAKVIIDYLELNIEV